MTTPTPPDFRAELQRLVHAYDEHGGKWPDHHEQALFDAVQSARAALDQLEAAPVIQPLPGLLKRLDEIVDGIDRDQCSGGSAGGWWETSYGVTFGKIKLRKLRELVTDALEAQPEPVPVPGEGLSPRVGHILRLAEIIREVDGSHKLGASALAEAILTHPDSRWSPAIEPVVTPRSEEILNDD